MTEEIVNTTPEGEELSSDDKLWAALSWIPWVGWILAVIALLIEPQKNRPFVRFHAVQAIGANIILGILSMVLGITVILACIAPLLWLITIYPAIKAYQGEYLEIPWLTDFCRGQDWI
jgi:uncharacterized membrane protein